MMTGTLVIHLQESHFAWDLEVGPFEVTGLYCTLCVIHQYSDLCHKRIPEYPIKYGEDIIRNQYYRANMYTIQILTFLK